MSTDSPSHKVSGKAPSLFPLQVCFVVDNVPEAVAFCEEHYHWGPFTQFTINVEDAQYKDWCGDKRTEVALGMAGKVQMEFLHVHRGRDTTADYQQKYGTGFQHLGISVRSRDEAIAYLEGLGASVNETREVPGVHFGFVNIPNTGEGMFELLETTNDAPADSAIAKSREQKAKSQEQKTGDQGSGTGVLAPSFTLDRATIVTTNMADTLSFYAQAFNWQDPTAIEQTLQIEGQYSKALRYVGKAGFLELEIIEPVAGGSNPYSAHLDRGSHGLVHTGGALENNALMGETAIKGHWKETGESFELYDNFGVANSIQMRRN